MGGYCGVLQPGCLHLWVAYVEKVELMENMRLFPWRHNVEIYHEISTDLV